MSPPGWIKKPVALQEFLSDLGFRPDIVAALGRAAHELDRHPGGWDRILDFAAKWWDDRTHRLAPSCFPLGEALAVAATFPETVEAHRRRGISRAVTAATLRDLEVWLDDYRERHGAWGFDRSPWLWNHVRGKLFTLGRLQYAPASWSYPHVVFADSGSGEVSVTAVEGIFLSSEGWPRKEAGVVRTTLQTEPVVKGYPVSRRTGAVGLRPHVLPSTARRVLGPGDAVLNVHIPAGPRLETKACGRSFEDGCAFFRDHFPELELRGVICTSWLLDRELDRVLPADSGIIKFGRLFFPLIVADADDRQLEEKVLQAPRTSRLQTSIQRHRKAGGKFKLTGGFLLRPDSSHPRLFPSRRS